MRFLLIRMKLLIIPDVKIMYVPYFVCIGIDFYKTHFLYVYNNLKAKKYYLSFKMFPYLQTNNHLKSFLIHFC